MTRLDGNQLDPLMEADLTLTSGEQQLGNIGYSIENYKIYFKA